MSNLKLLAKILRLKELKITGFRFQQTIPNCTWG